MSILPTHTDRPEKNNDPLSNLLTKVFLVLQVGISELQNIGVPVESLSLAPTILKPILRNSGEDPASWKHSLGVEGLRI